MRVKPSRTDIIWIAFSADLRTLSLDISGDSNSLSSSVAWWRGSSGDSLRLRLDQAEADTSTKSFALVERPVYSVRLSA